MSLVFNDTATRRGLVQIYEKECGFERGDVSGDDDRLKDFAADANLAFDDYLSLAFERNGTWQFDDSNHEDYPIIYANLVAGRRDYAFTEDENDNLILDVFKVLIAGTDGVFRQLEPVDVSSQRDTTGFTDGRDGQGTPTRYDKLGNAFFLDAVPSYSASRGLKVYINREPSYFTYDDTDKKPGVPGNHHRYFAIKPAEDYARVNNLDNYNNIRAERIRLEENIRTTFATRTRDERPKRLGLSKDSNR